MHEKSNKTMTIKETHMKPMKRTTTTTNNKQATTKQHTEYLGRAEADAPSSSAPPCPLTGS